MDGFGVAIARDDEERSGFGQEIDDLVQRGFGALELPVFAHRAGAIDKEAEDETGSGSSGGPVFSGFAAGAGDAEDCVDVAFAFGEIGILMELSLECVHGTELYLLGRGSGNLEVPFGGQSGDWRSRGHGFGVLVSG